MTDLPQNEDFDRWLFTAQDERINLDDGKPVPVMTTVLYRVCGNDPKRFEEACRALQLAFEAGASAGRAGSSSKEGKVTDAGRD